ncbi:MAG TPA: histidine kinase [Anseongella sp.]|nr:histidine kinase [Anseongella sp.]
MKASERNWPLLKVLLHLFVWGIIFSTPFLFIEIQGVDLYNLRLLFPLFRFLLPLFLSAMIFYANYLFLIDRLFFNKKILLFVLANVSIIIACILLLEQAAQLIQRPGLPSLPQMRGGDLPLIIIRRVFSDIRTLTVFVLAVGVSITIRLTQKWLRSEAERKTVETEMLKSELAHLQYQLQPHFFFNSLNSIYSMIDQSPEKAKEAVYGLGKLLRYLLYEIKDGKISLTKEIEFLRKFIQLMELRLPGRVVVRYIFPENTCDHEVAPLLFIPLVENAFKHGVAAGTASTISIEMKIKDDCLLFLTKNRNAPKRIADRSGSGIGLPNLRKRLELLYKGSYEFTQYADAGIFHTRLSIRL